MNRTTVNPERRTPTDSPYAGLRFVEDGRRRPIGDVSSGIRMGRRLIAALALGLGGCQSAGYAVTASDSTGSTPSNIQLVSAAVLANERTELGDDERMTAEPQRSTLDTLVDEALAMNPKLERLAREVEAAWAKVPQVRGLPDPMFDAQSFTQPMDEAAQLMLSQTIPWPKRLGLSGQQAALEAEAMDRMLAAERLILTAKVKERYFELYVLEKELVINRENQNYLEPLAKVALARVGAGAPNARQGDVLRATLELSRLAEQEIGLRQQIVTARAKLNELLNRPADTRVVVSQSLAPKHGDWPYELLRTAADETQPELRAAELRVEASRLGIRVAQLARVPDVSLNFGHTFMHDGNGAWMGGGNMNVPIVWRRKYLGREIEAVERNRAAAADWQEVRRRYDAFIADWLEQARAADQTVQIYRQRIIPQAQQTLEADRLAYEKGDIEFDRVIIDFRERLDAEVMYQRAVGRLATALAMLEQAVGMPLESVEAPNKVQPGDGNDERKSNPKHRGS
jgi:outer membrane protein TolC